MHKSFLIYNDYNDKFFKHLNATQSGHLIKELFKLQDALNNEVKHICELEEPALIIAYNQIEDTMIRDHEKWLRKARVAKENGNKGGRPKK